MGLIIFDTFESVTWELSFWPAHAIFFTDIGVWNDWPCPMYILSHCEKLNRSLQTHEISSFRVKTWRTTHSCEWRHIDLFVYPKWHLDDSCSTSFLKVSKLVRPEWLTFSCRLITKVQEVYELSNLQLLSFLRPSLRHVWLTTHSTWCGWLPLLRQVMRNFDFAFAI